MSQDKKKLDDLSQEEYDQIIRDGETKLEEKLGITPEDVERIDKLLWNVENGTIPPLQAEDRPEYTDTTVIAEYLIAETKNEAELALMVTSLVSRINRFKNELVDSLGPMGTILGEQL